MNKRWYDADPVIANAVKLFQEADEEKKNQLSGYIINQAKALGVEIEENDFDCFWHKRQDENAKYIAAIECLKALEDETKREIAFKIISMFNNTHS